MTPVTPRHTLQIAVLFLFIITRGYMIDELQFSKQFPAHNDLRTIRWILADQATNSTAVQISWK
jgi:hypothetical protein